MSHNPSHMKAVRDAVKKVWEDHARAVAAAPPGQKPTIADVKVALLDVPARVRAADPGARRQR